MKSKFYLRRAYKYLTSFLKKDWSFNDYPIRIVQQKIPESEGQFKTIPWTVNVIWWFRISGHGDTKEEALTQARQAFDDYKKENNTLPRPGTRVPFQIASTDKIDKHDNLFDDFNNKILGFNGPVFVSDESSLWDFCMDDTLDEYFDKILHVYHVDVKNVEGANLVKILNKISEYRKKP